MNRKITELDCYDCYMALAADEYSQRFQLSDKDTKLVMDAAVFISERIHLHLSGKYPFPEKHIELFNKKVNELADLLIEEGQA